MITTTPEQQAFLSKIIANPDDTGLRLVYADWLDETGTDPLRAEFIRLQCEPLTSMNSHNRDGYGYSISMYKSGVLGRLQEIVHPALHWDWLPDNGMIPGAPKMSVNLGVGEVFFNVQGTHNLVCFVFRRGFCEEIRCRSIDWMMSADLAVQEHPIRLVRLMDVPQHEISEGGQQGRIILPNGTEEKLRQVRFTNYPKRVWWRDEIFRRATVHDSFSLVKEMLRDLWPKIEFVLPEPEQEEKTHGFVPFDFTPDSPSYG